MSRGLDEASKLLLESNGQFIGHFIIMNFDIVERYTTTSFDIEHDLGDGLQTYINSPKFISFGDVNETVALELGSMAFIMSGVDLSSISTALSGNVIDKKIELYRFLIDPSTYQIVGSPQLIYSGRIKSFNMSENPGDTSTFTWNTASIFADFEYTAGRRSNQQDQEVYLNIRYKTLGTVTTFEGLGNILRDSTASFTSLILPIGSLVTNITDGSSGIVLGITSDIVLVMSNLTGGTLNQWVVDDEYSIVPVDKGFEFAHQLQPDLPWG